MSPAPLTAIERARLAYEDLKRRQHGAEVQRRARERSRNITLAAIVVGALLLVAGIAIYNGGPESLRATAHETRGDRTRSTEARTGQVRSYVKGNVCRQLQFNNDSGTFVGGNLVACDTDEAKRDSKQVQSQPQAAPKPNGARINSIRDGFAR